MTTKQDMVDSAELNQHNTREFISTGKTSHRQNNKDVAKATANVDGRLKGSTHTVKTQYELLLLLLLFGFCCYCCCLVLFSILTGQNHTHVVGTNALYDRVTKGLKERHLETINKDVLGLIFDLQKYQTLGNC